MKNKISKITKLAVIIPLSIIACSVLIGVLLYNQFVTPIYNIRLYDFVDKFEDIPLPDDTYSIGQTYQKFGSLGNGNHCDYFVSKLIVTELTETELKNYYENYTIPPANPNGLMEINDTHRDSSPVDIKVWQPWLVTSVRGPYYEGTRADAIAEELLVSAEQYKVDISDISEKTFVVQASDGNYKATYLVCH